MQAPTRELAVTRLEGIKSRLETKLKRVEALIHMAKHAESGSVLEEALWDVSFSLEKQYNV